MMTLINKELRAVLDWFVMAFIA